MEQPIQALRVPRPAYDAASPPLIGPLLAQCRQRLGRRTALDSTKTGAFPSRGSCQGEASGLCSQYRTKVHGRTAVGQGLTNT